VSPRFDASSKHLFDEYLADMVPLSGRTPAGPTEVIDSDVSTVTAAADKVVLVREAAPWVFHCEPHTYRDPDLPRRLNVYNALLEYRHGVPVLTVVLLMRREADHADLNGLYQQGFPGQPPYRTFRYEVVRLWEQPVAAFLSGGLGLLPLAPLCDVREDDLPEVIRRMDERIAREATPAENGTLWTATGVLMGLRYPSVRIAEMLQGVQTMQESTFYQYIVEQGRAEGIVQGVAQGIAEGIAQGIAQGVAQGRAEGRIQECQEVLLRLGRKKFGDPTEAVLQGIQGINDLTRLEQLSERLLDVATWDDLLATP
jgi:predicted transposase YdaD